MRNILQFLRRINAVQLIAIVLWMIGISSLVAHLLNIKVLTTWAHENHMLMPTPTAFCMVLIAIALFINAEHHNLP